MKTFARIAGGVLTLFGAVALLNGTLIFGLAPWVYLVALVVGIILILWSI